MDWSGQIFNAFSVYETDQRWIAYAKELKKYHNYRYNPDADPDKVEDWGNKLRKMQSKIFAEDRHRKRIDEIMYRIKIARPRIY